MGAVADLHKSKRSTAWGPPDSRGSPNLYKKGCEINDNAFNKITAYIYSWGMGRLGPHNHSCLGPTRPKSGPGSGGG